MCKRHYEAWLAVTPASQKAWRRSDYPDDSTMILWAQKAVSLSALARRVGVRRESLRSYLARRPVLNASVREAALPRRLSLEVAKANNNRAKQAWKVAHPDAVRAINRRWGVNQDPAKRHRWNTYNRRRRANLLMSPPDEDSIEFIGTTQRDPCSYCSGLGGEADHVRALMVGGSDHWTNYTGACRSCNASKGTDDLLQFMLRKATEEDQKVPA